MPSWKASVLEAEAAMSKRLISEPPLTLIQDVHTPVSEDKAPKSPTCPTSTTLSTSSSTPLCNGLDPSIKSIAKPSTANKKKCSNKKNNSVVKTPVKSNSSSFSKLLSSASDGYKTAQCKSNPVDSPYSDIDSVPKIFCPKRSEESPQKEVVQESSTKPKKDQPSKKTKKACSDKPVKKTEAATNSKLKKSTPKDKTLKVTNSRQKESSSPGSDGSFAMHSFYLPASSGLMSRALAASEETEDVEHLSQKTEEPRSRSPRADGDRFDTFSKCTSPNERSESSKQHWQVKTETGEESTDESLSHTPPNPTLIKFTRIRSEKNGVHNGPHLKNRFEGSKSELYESPTNSVKIKNESMFSDTSSLSVPSPSISPTDVFQDTKELSFRSLVKEECNSGEPSLRADSNYKFSTFLMLLKDLHDSREKEGKALTLPPTSPSSLIREEPSLIPAGEDTTAEVLCKKEWKDQNGRQVKTSTPNSSKQKSKPKSSAKKEAPKQEDASNLISQVNKQNTPGGLDTHETVLPQLPGLSNSYLNAVHDVCGKSLLSKVAPKKRWQKFESSIGKSLKPKSDAVALNQDVTQVSAELNGIFKESHETAHLDIPDKKESSGQSSKIVSEV